MSRFTDSKNVTNSEAFRSWCESAEAYIGNFENELIEKIATKLQPISKRPRIIQGLCPKPYIAQLEELGLFPMPLADEINDRNLFFAPLSESDIDSLCQGTHTLLHAGQQLPARLKRSKAYLNNEKELSCYFGDHMIAFWAKRNYLPDLGFPFLPYSRKFLQLELPQEVISDYHKSLTNGTILDKLRLQNGRLAAEAKLRADLVPVWNVRGQRLTVGPQVDSTEKGHHVWRPRSTDFMNQGESHIVHRAFDRWGNPVSIIMNAGRIESELKFHTLELSTLHKVKHLPSIMTYPVEGAQTVNVSDNFWYRNFFQSMSLTRSDLDVLLRLLPETDSYLRIRSIELGRCSQSLFNRFKSHDRSFFDYLWYLEAAKQTSALTISDISVLELEFEPLKEKNGDDAFLLEDRANYFTSICKLHLPVTVECWGEVRTIG